MSFRSPWMLGLLVAVPLIVAAYVRARRRRARRAAELAEQGLVQTAASAQVGFRKHVPFTLFAAALTVLIVGTARPQASVKTPKREGTVILAVDTSNSMRADDVKPTRLEAAKATARAFVKRQPPAVRIGVVAFGDGAVSVQAPTTSHDEAVRAIDRLTPAGGTSIGQALVASLTAIAGKPITIDPQALASDAGNVDVGYYGGATIVVLSDGEETSRPDPVDVAQVASVAGVRVDTIGIGTDAGTVVQIDGFNVATALDSQTLKDVASKTDGAYYEGNDAAGLAAISKAVNLRFKVVSQHTEISGIFAAAGALLLLAGAVMSVLWFGRVI